MKLPENLTPLYNLALDLTRISTEKASELWEKVSPEIWEHTRNPFWILQTLSQEKIDALAQDESFLKLLASHEKMWKEAHSGSTWFSETHPEGKDLQIAYFSMEFGLSEALPIYSGGLGILSGDHLKTSSDLGIPLVGVGLLYGQGYFRQDLNCEGRQTEYYPYNDPSQLPITELSLRFSLDFPGRKVWIRVFEVKVGRIKLYLLDANDPLNIPADRGITSELYGGDREMRLKQEFLLGIGGWKMLGLMGLKPTVCHLNEGHAAFAILERIKEKMQEENCDFKTALRESKKHTLFTTHTPVAAGFDTFDDALMEHYFGPYIQDLQIPLDTLLSLGKSAPDEPFNMAAFAIRGSNAINGVSKLHGEVSKELFAKYCPDVPISSITNGIHVPSWESIEADRLWAEFCGAKRWMGTMEEAEEKIQTLSDEKLWNFRKESRSSMIAYVRKRISIQKRSSSFHEQEEALDPDVLTLGFARRFATYKRVDLLLKDTERLKKILQSSERPVQIIIAGKAHPQDEDGKAMIEKWTHFLQDEDISGKVVFLTDYDILLTERLVHGVDVWINTPRRPWEACGTSGMKLLVNGGLMCSELDGWWAEAYRPEVGWPLGGGENETDEQDALDLYKLLEEEIIPLFYEDRKNWLKKIRESMATLTREFSTNRMVREYTETFYLPLHRSDT